MSDFEEVYLPTDKMDMEGSNYSQVVFHNVKEMYPVEAHVVCHFTITGLLHPTDRDWVGLFKVGWRTSNDYTCYEYVKLPKEKDESQNEIESNILFQAVNLPKDDGEFYQFCYVSSNGQIHGASTPFQFREPCSEDFVEEQDGEDEDLMVIKTKTCVLQESLAKANVQMAEVTKKCMELEAEGAALKKQLAELKSRSEIDTEEKEEIQKQLQETQESVQVLQAKLKESCMTIETCNSQMAKLIEEKSILEDDCKEIVQEKKMLVNSNDSLTGQLNALQKRSEMQIESLTERLRNCEDKLEAAEHCKILINEEVTTMQQAYTKMTTALEAARSEAHECKGQLEKQRMQFMSREERQEEEFKAMEASFIEKSRECDELATKLDTAERNIREVKENHVKEEEGPMYALKVALEAIKGKYMKQQEKCRELQVKLENGGQISAKDEERDLIRENEDLKERLQMGAAAYKKKYIECEKLKKQLRRVSSRSSSEDKELSERAGDSSTEEADARYRLPPPRPISTQEEEATPEPKSEAEVKPEPESEPEPSAPEEEEVEEHKMKPHLPPQLAVAQAILTPLPPPIAPEILPSAKAALFKAAMGMPVVTEGNFVDCEEEEQFQDAQGEPQRSCPFCSLIFPIDCRDEAFEEHVEAHIGPVCPMCQKQFPQNFIQEEFEEHVQHHFDVAME